MKKNTTATASTATAKAKTVKKAKDAKPAATVTPISEAVEPAVEPAVKPAVEPEKESAVDRWLDKKAAEKEAKENPSAAKPADVPAAKPAAAAKPAVPAKTKTSRFSTTAIKLVNPDAASPAWKGKRGEAFGVIETFYVNSPKGTLTVGDWLATVAATPSLTKVGFEFLRFYEQQALITLTPVESAKPAATDPKAVA